MAKLANVINLTFLMGDLHLCQDCFAIILGAGQAGVEVTGLLGRQRRIISWKKKKEFSIYPSTYTVHIASLHPSY